MAAAAKAAIRPRVLPGAVAAVAECRRCSVRQQKPRPMHWSSLAAAAGHRRARILAQSVQAAVALRQVVRTATPSGQDVVVRKRQAVPRRRATVRARWRLRRERNSRAEMEPMQARPKMRAAAVVAAVTSAAAAGFVKAPRNRMAAAAAAQPTLAALASPLPRQRQGRTSFIQVQRVPAPPHRAAPVTHSTLPASVSARATARVAMVKLSFSMRFPP